MNEWKNCRLGRKKRDEPARKKWFFVALRAYFQNFIDFSFFQKVKIQINLMHFSLQKSKPQWSKSMLDKMSRMAQYDSCPANNANSSQ